MIEDLEVSTEEISLKLFSSALDLTISRLTFHHKQTAYLSFKIASAMGLPDSSQRELSLASLIHDLGLFWGEEEDISDLQNPSAPTPWRHCLVAYYLLKDFPLINQTAPNVPRIILYHHTRWRDVQEPEKASGLRAVTEFTKQELPLESFILHLSGIVSHLANPQKPILLQANEIKEKIKELSGYFFPEEVVEAFMEVSSKEATWLDLVSPFLEEILYQMNPLPEYKLNKEELISLSELFCFFIDFKSHYTAFHSRGVAKTAEEIGKLLSLPQFEIDILKIAGNLHDFGKLGLSPSIIEKAGKLSEEEFALVKEHAYLTYIILNRLKGFEKIRDAAGFHHERLDGSGYPFKLKGEEIPLHARIMAVADVFSALREKRPYRPVLEMGEVISIMEKDAREGKLDPEIVSSLISHRREIDAHHLDIQFSSMQRYQEIFLTLSSLLDRGIAS
jgi:HD-GYP domain-containing protein (c-di-GMP phosphodiesterase class II)